jgi:TPR repeat protein
MRLSVMACCVVLALTSSSHAAEIVAMPVGNDPEIGAIAVEGEFILSDVEKFRKAIFPFSKAFVALKSDGGSVVAGIQIGELIRFKNYSTIVADGTRCASACALAWLGGTKRLMGVGAQIGFHAAFVVRSGQANESGAANALVGAYLNKLGLPDRAVIYITQAPPESMTWLNLAEAQRKGIDVVRYSPYQSVRAGPLGDGFAAVERRDFATALRLFRPLAEQGNADAQNELGVMYARGLGVTQSYREAVKWYRLAAGQQHAVAQSNLGFMFYQGEGVPQDYNEAAKWFRLSADQGYPEAQNNLGTMYRSGQGVSRDFKEALKWFRLGAEQGFGGAQVNLGAMYATGFGPGATQTEDLLHAHMWLNLGASSLDGEQGQKAAKSRDFIAARLKPAQLTRAQEMARECQARHFKKCE